MEIELKSYFVFVETIGKTALLERRNIIAQQNDLSHASDEQNDMRKESIIAYIPKIEAIVFIPYII